MFLFAEKFGRAQIVKSPQGWWEVIAYCGYCGNCFRLRHLTRDHVIRVREGGSWRMKNLILSCRLCNSSREAPYRYHIRKWLRRGVIPDDVKRHCDEIY